MHFHLPKPLHGWREFAGEVGIIVLGVLIALGFEQVVETLHWRSELAAFRSALNREVARDLEYYDYRISQRACISRRIDDLNRWRDLERSGHDGALLRDIGRPRILTFDTSVWRSRSPDVSEHMPIDNELAYANMYDSFDGLNAQLLEERDAWRSLAAFNGAAHLSSDNIMRLSELIYRVKSLDRAIDANGPALRADAAELRITPNWGGYRRYTPAHDPDFCKPLLPTADRN